MRSRTATAIVAAALSLSTSLASLTPGGTAAAGVDPAAMPAGLPASGTVDLVVRAVDGRSVDAGATFAALGGRVTRVLPIIGGFAGTIAVAAVDELVAAPGVAAVTVDDTIRTSAVDPALGYDAADTSSLSAITQITGAQDLWNQGFTGQGIDVAVIDTGVAQVPGLDRPGKVIDGPDLSFDNVEPTLRYTDAFGHGTHMASIIAGTDVASGTPSAPCATCLGPSAYTDTSKFVGVAPDARIVNVKVGAHDGAADVSQVIAAIDWVVQHRRDNGLNIRVLNLSFGTDSVQTTVTDPLIFAAEQAWKAGIVVVAAAGNDGVATLSLANPARSPIVIAVGATDPKGTLDTSDDVVADFAQKGNLLRTADLVAPGVSVIGLRVPGGFVDQQVTVGKVGTRFQRASGTSQATAVVSGLVALVLSKYPDANPDAVKAYLKGNAKDLVLTGLPAALNPVAAMINSWYAGDGSAYVGGSAAPVAVAAQKPRSNGTGSLELARGSFHVTNGSKVLKGEVDIFGSTWNGKQMATLTAAQSTWSGGVWNGARWSGDGWSGARWSHAEWTGADWSGARWSGARWTSMIWDGARWSGARWSGARWSDASWS